MVWFTLTFLLGMPNPADLKADGNPKEKKKKVEEKVEEKNYSEIVVSKPNFSCHIEYVLLPNEEPRTIDIVCWNHAAKIYSQNSSAAIMPLVTGKLRWIYFHVNHKVILENKDVPTLHSHKINISVTLDSKKLGETAKSDKVKKFYSPKLTNRGDNYAIQKQIFQPLSEKVEDLQSVSFYKSHLTYEQQLFVELDTTIETSKNCSKLYKTLMRLTKEYHDPNVVKKPTSLHQGFPPVRNLLTEELERMKEKEKQNEEKKDEEKKKNVKKKKKGKEKEEKPEEEKQNKEKKKKKGKEKDKKKKEALSEKAEFSIMGEEFFSEKKIFENCLKYNLKELPYIFSLVSVKDLLTKAQAALFNPLFITIRDFNYLSVDKLAKNGITKLKLEYLICNEFLVESNLKLIDKRIKFDYTRSFLTNKMDMNQLIYFIQTGGLKINVLGNPPERTQLEIKNGHYNSKSNHESEFILLGRMFVDISAILLQPHKLVLNCDFHLSPNIFYLKKPIDSNNYTTVNEFNFCHTTRTKEPNFKWLFPLTSPILTISVGLGHPLTNIQETVGMNPNLFNRLFVVLCNINLALQIFGHIQGEASELMEPVDYIKKGKNVRPLMGKNFKNLPNIQCAKRKQITGFAVDCVDKIFIYVESSVFGAIQKIWALASNLDPSEGHALYDSSLIFCDRLYEIFFKHGGFFSIALKESPKILMSRCKSYGKKNIPEPAWEALKCLDLLAKCKSMKAATQNNLFPNPDSLCSLAMEFGVPVQFCGKKEGVNN